MEAPPEPEPPPASERAASNCIWGLHPWIQTTAFWLCLFSTAFLAFFYFVLGDSTWWSEPVTLWPSYLYALGLLPLALLTFRPSRWMRFAIAMGAALLFLGFSYDWRSIFRSAPREKPSGTDIRLMIWNIASYRSEPRDVLDVIENLAPDICLMQEAYDLVEAPLIDLQLPHRLLYGEFAILSRWPIRALPEPIGSERWSQSCLVDTASGETLLVTNVHMGIPGLVWQMVFANSPINHPDHHASRMQSYQALGAGLQQMQSDVDAVLLAGDFNIDGVQFCQRPLQPHLREIWGEAGAGWGATYPTRLPLSRLDQCWVTDNVRAIQARVVRVDISDHDILLIDLELLP